MKRLNLLLLPIAALGLASACQKEAPRLTLDEIFATLEANSGEGYSFDFRSTFLTPIPEEGVSLSVVKAGTHLVRPNWEDCSFVEVTIDSIPFRTFFQKTDRSMAHVLYEAGSGEEPEWACQAMAQPHPKPMGPVNIYSHGGWNYCSQALALIETFGSDSVSFSGKVATFKWDSVSKKIGTEMLDHYSGAGWGENTEVSSITLQIDGAIGAPVLFRLDLANGESVETAFEGYGKVIGEYGGRVKELRKRLNVSPELKCWCEGKIYEANLPLEGVKNS